MNYWIMKTEPDTFSIQDLETQKTTDWEGVRNYQARNFMRDQMKLNDQVLIYHSSCKNVGIAGIAKVCKESHPDLSSLDKQSPYYDAKATKENPRWYMVSLEWIKTFPRIITLAELKENTALSNMQITKKGNRLSITPISKLEYQSILKML